MFAALKSAKLVFFAGIGLIVWGIYEEGADLLSIVDQEQILGTAITIWIECVINKFMIEMCFCDLILVGIVKMRLYNGYMADDVVLTSFCLLQGYSEDLNKQFTQGFQQGEERKQRSMGSIEDDGSSPKPKPEVEGSSPTPVDPRATVGDPRASVGSEVDPRASVTQDDTATPERATPQSHSPLSQTRSSPQGSPREGNAMLNPAVNKGPSTGLLQAIAEQPEKSQTTESAKAGAPSNKM